MAETLSYYITYQTHFISPDSINSYLYGIINQLKPFLVKWTLKGARRMHSKGVCHKTPLLVWDLESMQGQLAGSSSFDDLPFEVQLNTRFMGLFRMGKLVENDKLALQDWKKLL